MFVSSQGADHKSSSFYLKLKGEIEQAVFDLKLSCCSVFRPSLLLGKRNENRPGEQIAQWIMPLFSFLLPIASKIVSDAIDKIPDDAELGEKLIDLCLLILKKAVKLTKTDMDDKLLAQVETAIKAR